MNSSFADFLLSNQVLLLDGGMGCELQRIGVPRSQEIWSANALLYKEYNAKVVEAHLGFLDAGADIVITSNYACVYWYFNKLNIQDKVSELNALSGQLARSAVQQYCQSKGKKIWIAGSLPPNGESWQESQVNEEVYDDLYSKISEALTPQVDFFIVETQSSIAEAAQALKSFIKVNQTKPVFVSFSINEEALIRNGDTLQEAVKVIESIYNVQGYMLNCCTPLSALTGIQNLTQLTNKPLGVYYNACIVKKETRPSESETATPQIEFTDEQIEEFTKSFLGIKQVRFIGGCCGIYPKQIRIMRKVLDSYISS